MRTRSPLTAPSPSLPGRWPGRTPVEVPTLPKPNFPQPGNVPPAPIRDIPPMPARDLPPVPVRDRPPMTFPPTRQPHIVPPRPGRDRPSIPGPGRDVPMFPTIPVEVPPLSPGRTVDLPPAVPLYALKR